MICLLGLSIFLLIGCTQKLAKNKQQIEDKGISYEFQLPAGWETSKAGYNEYGLQAAFNAEDKKSNSYVFISSVPVKDVPQKDFGKQTREKLKKRYHYKDIEGIYMKKITVNKAPAYKYTLNTTYKEKSVWAHLYYIWTKHGFVQLTYYSADDNSYKKRSKIIDESVATFKETGFDEGAAEVAKNEQREEEGDVISIINHDIKMETTGVRQVTGENQKKLLAIRYTFTNLMDTPIQPVVWNDYVTAKQNGNILSIGKLSADSNLLDLKELINNQSKEVKRGEAIETTVLYELKDMSNIELSFSQDAFPGEKAVEVVIPQ
ncbi:hypothetical protein RU98_GL000859 [Enterococcus caccae]|nr:hypothetical protein RU98_GL000859 [Enterococcus caccae]